MWFHDHTSCLFINLQHLFINTSTVVAQPSIMDTNFQIEQFYHFAKTGLPRFGGKSWGKYFLQVRENVSEFWQFDSCQGTLSLQFNFFLKFFSSALYTIFFQVPIFPWFHSGLHSQYTLFKMLCHQCFQNTTCLFLSTSIAS